MKKDINLMSVKELKNYIRKQTAKANKRIEHSNQLKRRTAKDKLVRKGINILERKGYIGKKGQAVLGFRGKTKEQLQYQARELQYFNEWKPTQSEVEKRQKVIKQYDSFRENNPGYEDISFDEYRQLIDFFGTFDNIIEEFGYNEIKNIQKDYENKVTPINLAKEMQKVIKDNPGLTDQNGKTAQEVATDLLRSALDRKYGKVQ